MVNTQHPTGQWNAAPEMVVAIHNHNPEPTPLNFILVESRANQKRKERRESEQKNIFEEDGETTEEESETESEEETSWPCTHLPRFQTIPRPGMWKPGGSWGKGHQISRTPRESLCPHRETPQSKLWSWGDEPLRRSEFIFPGLVGIRWGIVLITRLSRTQGPGNPEDLQCRVGLVPTLFRAQGPGNRDDPAGLDYVLLRGNASCAKLTGFAIRLRQVKPYTPSIQFPKYFHGRRRRTPRP
jgi:hypothetical protein